MSDHAQIIDANLNRAAEGIRVIEDFVRFVWSDERLSEDLSRVRHKIAHSEVRPLENLLSRHKHIDARAKAPPRGRISDFDLLKANFKRVQEALRVLEEYCSEPLYNHLRYEMYDFEKEILLRLEKKVLRSGVYLISHDPDILIKGIDQGVSLIQLRDKSASKSEIFNKAKTVKSRLNSTNVPFIINDFIDIAQCVDADGVHTGQDDLSILDLRKLWGPHKLIGRTTHTLEQGKQAEIEGADYISIGPIWETPSKPNRSAIGFDYLKVAPKEIQIPYVAIGGISLDTLDEILPFSPPLIGLIRDYAHIPEMLQRFQEVKCG